MLFKKIVDILRLRGGEINEMKVNDLVDLIIWKG
jgi:hypothetical protein